MEQILIRDPRPTDLNFITSSFLKSIRRESSIGRATPKEIFYRDFPKVIDHILSQSIVTIAALTENDDAIIGFMIHQPNHIHYIYVKAAFRGLDIAKELVIYVFRDNRKLTYSFSTNDSKKIQIKYPELNYNPFYLYPKEINE